jgi:hypothetical protein
MLGLTLSSLLFAGAARAQIPVPTVPDPEPPTASQDSLPLLAGRSGLTLEDVLAKLDLLARRRVTNLQESVDFGRHLADVLAALGQNREVLERFKRTDPNHFARILGVYENITAYWNADLERGLLEVEPERRAGTRFRWRLRFTEAAHAQAFPALLELRRRWGDEDGTHLVSVLIGRSLAHALNTEAFYADALPEGELRSLLRDPHVAMAMVWNLDNHSENLLLNPEAASDLALATKMRALVGREWQAFFAKHAGPVAGWRPP